MCLKFIKVTFKNTLYSEQNHHVVIYKNQKLILISVVLYFNINVSNNNQW